MAGINRLGKAPPRPGSLRPPDPNRNRVLDIYSEGTEGDADYMRMVQDIEDVQQSQVGWLFGRGAFNKGDLLYCAAFDKGDLLYLRDEEEKRRFKEEELRDSERAQFLRMQASSGAGPGPGSDPTLGSKPAPTRAAQRERPARSQARLLASLVKVKASRPAVPPKHDDSAPREGPPLKRLKATDAVPATIATGTGVQPEKDGAAGLVGLVGDYGSDEEELSGDAGKGQLAAAANEDTSNGVAVRPAASSVPDVRSSVVAGGGVAAEQEENVDYSENDSDDGS